MKMGAIMVLMTEVMIQQAAATPALAVGIVEVVEVANNSLPTVFLLVTTFATLRR
ncbi:hypothetical protein U9J35_11750 [Rossellomorea aquimaris]|nr:hypothetical protein [Rossellomorea aquimaris]WRP04592.1 hypothetical protein U9J35_11750 [Rossellomorea aquimaris]